MPYITTTERKKFSSILSQLPGIASPGELNYILTLLCKHYIEGRGLCYQTYNDALGALEGCKLELYRRQIASYEDQKIQMNGDVYE